LDGIKASYIQLGSCELWCFTSDLIPCNPAENKESQSRTFHLAWLYAQIRKLQACIDTYLYSFQDSGGCSREKARYLQKQKKRYIPSAKCIYVTGSLWECLRVVGPESQGGQIPELTGPSQWRSGAPASTRECRQQAGGWWRQPWEHLESL
jgi:hypothetical protein